jgi:two-component system, OmpR family, sensor histidine kinase BaeS
VTDGSTGPTDPTGPTGPTDPVPGRDPEPAAGPPWSWGGNRSRGDRAWRGRPHGPRGGPWAAHAGDPRPEWWPDESPWPPRRRQRWRGFGCLFGFLFLAGVIGLVSFATSLVGRVLEAPGPFGHVIRFASVVVVVGVVVALARSARAIRGSGSVLDALVEQAARVEAGDYSARVDVVRPAPAPVRGLARGFNTMAARLEADEAQRRTLLADVTHELRTPLAVVQGSVEAILDGVHPADETHLSAILEETRILDRLIEDLRTLALSESGALSLHREPTDLSILATDVATSFAATATAAGIELGATVDDDLPLLDVDPVRIREVIGNLVANALRHTPAGGRITIGAGVVQAPGATGARGGRATRGAGATSPAGATGATRAAGASGADAIEIAVRDTGSGIDPERLPHVFDRFARGARSTGSGLGLSIARGLVELHGGTIEATSAPGGTEVRIRLPIEPPAR